MSRSILVIGSVLAVGCSQGAVKPETGGIEQAKRTELGIFMKTVMNPPFSKLSFLLFHAEGEGGEVDPASLPATATELDAASIKLSEWPQPPGDSEQGRQVFFEYAAQLKVSSAGLVKAVGSKDLAVAQKQYEALRKVCNDCHHFFRYEPVP